MDIEQVAHETAEPLRDMHIQEILHLFHRYNPFFYTRGDPGLLFLWNHQLKIYERSDFIDIANKLNEFAVNTKRNDYNYVYKLIHQKKTNILAFARLHIPEPFPTNAIQFKDELHYTDSEIVEPANPKYFNMAAIPWELGLDTKTPTINKLFMDWVGSKYLQNLYEIISYCMLQDMPLHVWFCLIGSGRNGKSTFIKILQNALGSNNCSSVELKRLLERFGSAGMYKKLVNISSDTSYSKLQETGLLKRLTGGDYIDFEFKGKDIITEPNYTKLIVSANQLPITTDRTKGFYSRPFIIPFNNQFLKSKDVLKNIPEWEYKNLMNKCFILLKQLLKCNKFFNQASIEERQEMYEDYSNPLRKFVNEKCVLDPSADIPGFQFRDELNVWLKSNNYVQMSDREVTINLKDEYGVESKPKHVTKDDGGDTTWRYYLGIRLKDQVGDYDESKQ